MPIINLRQQSLFPEGEYCGQARKVSQEWIKPKPRFDGTTPEPYLIFRVPLWTNIGKPITHTLRVMESTGWMWQQACKSGEMIPESEEFKISPDDLENRVFYFGVIHTEYNGVRRAEVRMHTQAYAIKVNPALEKVTFPNAAPRPIYLKSVNPAEPVPNSQFPAESVAIAAPPKSDSAPALSVPPPSPVAPIIDITEQPAINPAPPEGITEDEFREALAYAKRLTEEKRNPKGNAA